LDTNIKKISDIVISAVKELRVPESNTGVVLLNGQVSRKAIELAMRIKKFKIEKSEVLEIAENEGIQLFEIGGNGQGIIGAFAAAVLASTGNDGRYLDIGGIRNLKGIMRASDLLSSKGVDQIKSIDNNIVDPNELILVEKVRPKRENFKAILYVRKRADGVWEPVKMF